MAFTLCGPAFQQVHLASGLVTLLTRSYNPAPQAGRFGLFRFRSPLLSESRLIYFPPGTEMVHFPGLARTRLCIQRAVSRVHRDGFPHSEIPGSKPACGSPGLIAACHVLHRLLAPRHPPHALSSLTIKLTQHVVSRAHPDDVENARTMRRWISSPFLPPQKTGGFCSSRTCGLRGAIPCGSTTRNYQPYSVVKELLLRARRSPRLGRGRKTKNPASSAGLIRHPGRRICAMLDSVLSGIRNRPHFVPGPRLRDAGRWFERP